MRDPEMEKHLAVMDNMWVTSKKQVSDTPLAFNGLILIRNYRMRDVALVKEDEIKSDIWLWILMIFGKFKRTYI
mgnify:CR=1 FL=1